MLRLREEVRTLRRAGARATLLAAATEQTADLIVITRADGAIEHANDAFLRATGYAPAELTALRFGDLLERGFEKVGDHIAREVRDRGSWRGTLLSRRRNGSTFPAASTVVGLKNAAGEITHFVAVQRDTTEELKLRDQLVHSERLSAVGQLVAGVAHEINNPLQTIVGCTELMLQEGRDPAVRQDLELVAREAARAGQIVRNLLSFVRRVTTDRAPVDLNELARATVALRSYHLEQRGVRVAVELAPQPLTALVNREQIQQILVNLLINAEQALEGAAGPGAVTIRTSSSGLRHAVEVGDTGPGVSPELRGRIFEPFFTTKDVGTGTGLGLSISHGIAAGHGGSLELCDTPTGACFRLTLPAHAEPAAEAPAGPHPAPGVRRALVVDDKEAIRKLLGRLLERRGFAVVEADSAAGAFAAGAAGDFALVLCDVRMPGTSGVDVYRRLVEQDPSVRDRFVFITGDTTAVEGHALVLPKPFTASDLDGVLGKIASL